MTPPRFRHRAMAQDGGGLPSWGRHHAGQGRILSRRQVHRGSHQQQPCRHLEKVDKIISFKIVLYKFTFAMQ